MAQWNVYTGDGNNGTSRDHTIEAVDVEQAVRIYMGGVSNEFRPLFNDDDGDEETAFLTVLEGPEGERAHNGGAYFCAEIRLAETDPRA